jgi:sialate O-acetylesterase
MKLRNLSILSVLTALAVTLPIHAAVTLNPLFQDHAVLQQGVPVPVWGTADPGEKVTVEFASQSVATVAASDGKWLVRLAPLTPGEPRTLTVTGKNKIVLTDLLVGEVWIASGQSNMERQLGLRAGQKPITGWEAEVAAANYPAIRHFGVAQAKALAPQQTVKGAWSVCTPETVKDFTAVGYFFGRDLHLARRAPIGLIHTSWGGTPAEAWTSEATLRQLPDFAEPLAALKKLAADPDLARRETQAKQEAWYQRVDPGSKSGAAWSAARLEMSDWPPMALPTHWERAGYPDFDGIFWLRRTFELPNEWDGGDAELHLGAVDDVDTTWVNGVSVGATIGWEVPRVYRIPGALLKRGANVIAVRVLDTGAGGGLYGGNDTMRLIFSAGGKAESLSLAGTWRCKPSVPLSVSGWPPADFSQSPSSPTVLYNAMIAPLLPYAMRGVIWYQGEANVGRERQYQESFPAMIADWRQAWGLGDFPFLFVQIAPYNTMSPEIREAQLLSWQRTKNTAMAVTIDCGDANDIHPANKKPVGARLALAARALAYGEKLEYSGPVYESLQIKGAEAILSFTHLGGGLVARDGALKSFTIAGADKVFRPAQAEIRGETVVVSATDVPHPVAVRYSWANVPEGNLFNQAGLPASPFRTNVD